MPHGAPPHDEAELELRLSEPTPLSIAAVRGLEGELLVLGAGGKMGPSLLRLALRSAQAAGRPALRLTAVSRFSQPAEREALERDGIRTISCDLLDAGARAQLPECRHVLLMLGYKFGGATRIPGTYWAMNAWLPAQLAERYRGARIVAFSSGNIYPFVPRDAAAPTEETPPGPVGEYATTVWGREQLLRWLCETHASPTCLLRLNYAVDLRYGVLVDLGRQLLAGEPIDLSVPELNCLWQGDANAVALAAFGQASVPASILNVTGPERLRVRDLAERLAARLGVTPRFAGLEGDRSLLNDATRCWRTFGPPMVEIETLLDWVAAWLRSGGRLLGKPTGFQVRDGKF